jgi:hypothetical protein
MHMKTKSNAGKHVVLRGTARNAKGGAVIVAGDGKPVYIEHLDSWSDETLGSEVEVRGLLVSKKHIPDPVVDADGAISQGAWGDQDVLRGAKWQSIDRKK